MRTAAIRSITNDVNPVIRKAQASDRRSIIGVVATENMTPTTPDPDEAIPCARLRFVVNLQLYVRRRPAVTHVDVPLGNNWSGWQPNETSRDTDQQALGKEQMPELSRERGSNEAKAPEYAFHRQQGSLGLSSSFHTPSVHRPVRAVLLDQNIDP